MFDDCATKLFAWTKCIDRLCPTGGAAEPVSMQWVSPLHPPALPHQMDQWERLLGLWAVLLQVSGHSHQHQEPSAGELWKCAFTSSVIWRSEVGTLAGNLRSVVVCLSPFSPPGTHWDAFQVFISHLNWATPPSLQHLVTIINCGIELQLKVCDLTRICFTLISEREKAQRQPFSQPYRDDSLGGFCVVVIISELHYPQCFKRSCTSNTRRTGFRWLLIAVPNLQSEKRC